MSKEINFCPLANRTCDDGLLDKHYMASDGSICELWCSLYQDDKCAIVSGLDGMEMLGLAVSSTTDEGPFWAINVSSSVSGELNTYEQNG